MNETDLQHINTAKDIASLSKDRSIKVGCVIVKNDRVISFGNNSFPNGVIEKDERYQKPLKYKWTEHAERNAIFKAAYHGNPTNGSKMYITGLFPCSDCARAIIQAGIIEIFCSPPDFNYPIWGEDAKISHEILTECGIKINHINQ
jgi:dCMP deaminase